MIKKQNSIKDVNFQVLVTHLIPDGKFLATGEENTETKKGIVRIWNA